MPDLPSHPDFSAGNAAPPDPDSRPPGARVRMMVALLVVALLALIIALHVAGVLGPGTNG